MVSIYQVNFISSKVLPLPKHRKMSSSHIIFSSNKRAEIDIIKQSRFSLLMISEAAISLKDCI
jgi:hypothetical protein